MAQCKFCDNKGFFLSVDKDGLCKDCAPALSLQVQQSARVIKESNDIINSSKNTATRISRYDTILLYLKDLVELEQKGIPTLNISPSKLLQAFTDERDKILLEGTKYEVEELLTRPELAEGDEFDGTIDGYVFLATLGPRTPLKALEHHGEKVRGVPETELPVYGNIGEGIWLPFFDDDRYFRPLTKSQLRELEFVKKFRETYESNLSNERKHDIISALFAEYRDLPQQVSRAADWYLWELTEVRGISTSIAEVLYSESIKSKKDIVATSDEELLRIPGIGPGRLKQIRAYFSRST